MARNKRKPGRTHSADSINLEIDYEKLAEAIVKANNTVIAQKGMNKPQKKQSFWRGIWEIWRNKRDTDGQFMVATFSSIISVFFKTIALTSIFISGALFIIGLKHCAVELTWTWKNAFFNSMNIVIICVMSFLALLLATTFWGASNEIEREKDKNYILSVFSGIVALLSLVVTSITLFREG